jgi:putative membrane protein
MPLRYAGGMKFILKWLLAACALLLVAYLYPGVQVQSFGSAMIAAAVVGIFYTLLRPLLVVLTLPVTVVTLGLFLFVINALLFWAAARVLDGFEVSGFGAALLGSLIYSTLMMVVDAALRSILPD